MYTSLQVICLIEVLIIVPNDARIPVPYGWSEKRIRDRTERSDFAFYITLYEMKDYFVSDDYIQEARSCYLLEEKKYKKIIEQFTEELNSIFGALKDKFQRYNQEIIAKLQTSTYNVLNKVRNHPFDLNASVKPGCKDKLNKYMYDVGTSILHHDYELDIWMQRLLQEQYKNKQVRQCDDQILKIHKEATNECKDIMSDIKKCLVKNLKL